MRHVLLASLLALSACASSGGGGKGASTPATPGKSLYDRLGGKDAIGAVVDEFLKRVGADGAINARFANADMPRLRTMLIDQICAAAGGPCTYTGKDMRTAHTGMKVSDAEFDALVGDLKGALDQFKVGPQEQTELLGVLGGMKGDIVGL